MALPRNSSVGRRSAPDDRVDELTMVDASPSSAQATNVGRGIYRGRHDGLQPSATIRPRWLPSTLTHSIPRPVANATVRPPGGQAGPDATRVVVSVVPPEPSAFKSRSLVV